jgi:hypothetical protein
MQNRIGKHYRSINQSIFFVLKMRKKPKRKAKGKKRYRNTHGKWYRVRLGYKLRYKIKQRKILRELNRKNIKT